MAPSGTPPAPQLFTGGSQGDQQTAPPAPPPEHGSNALSASSLTSRHQSSQSDAPCPRPNPPGVSVAASSSTTNGSSTRSEQLTTAGAFATGAGREQMSQGLTSGSSSLVACTAERCKSPASSHSQLELDEPNLQGTRCRCCRNSSLGYRWSSRMNGHVLQLSWETRVSSGIAPPFASSLTLDSFRSRPSAGVCQVRSLLHPRHWRSSRNGAIQPLSRGHRRCSFPHHHRQDDPLSPLAPSPRHFCTANA